MAEFSNLDKRKAFDHYFDIERFPNPPKDLVLTDGVHEEAVSMASSYNMNAIDNAKIPVEEAIDNLRGDFSAIMGRSGFDSELKRRTRDLSRYCVPTVIGEKELYIIFPDGQKMTLVEAYDRGFLGSDNFAGRNLLYSLSEDIKSGRKRIPYREKEPSIYYKLRDMGCGLIVRLGNGVEMDAQKAFEDGLIVIRTPEFNKISVRMWQDLQLWPMLSGKKDIATRDNPVLADDCLIKSRGFIKEKKYKWDMGILAKIINPNSTDEIQGESEDEAAEYLAGKNVTILGSGMIGLEVIRKSPFLRKAKIKVFDIDDVSIDDPRVTMVDSKDDALRNADVLLLHMSGSKEEIGEKELSLLNRGAIICNNARGGIVNPKDLYGALENGHISQAALDTHYDEEKKDLLQPELIDFAHKLRNHPRVIASSHSAASEVHTQASNAREGIEAVNLFNRFGKIINPIAAPTVDFPFDGVLTEQGGILRPRSDLKGYRLATMYLHNGEISGLINQVQAEIEGKTGGKPLNRKSMDLKSCEYRHFAVCGGTHENSIHYEVFDLPEPFKSQFAFKRAIEINHAIEQVTGAYRAYTFVITPKGKSYITEI